MSLMFYCNEIKRMHAEVLLNEREEEEEIFVKSVMNKPCVSVCKL